MPQTLQIASLNYGLQRSIALATLRAGDLGVLDFEYVLNQDVAVDAIQRFNHAARGPFGIKLSGDTPELFTRIISDPPDNLTTVIVTSSRPRDFEKEIDLLRGRKLTTLLEATCIEHAHTGAAIGVDGLIAKGHESGGRIADETTFVLLQRFLAELNLPVWAHGGIGLHTAAACAAAGAAGLILDSQLALTRESPLSDRIKARIASMDGSETICLGEQVGEAYRMYFRPGNPAVKELQELEARLATAERPREEIRAEWRRAIWERAGWDSEHNVLLLGQDAAFAAPLAKRFRTVSGVLHAIREAVNSHCQAAVKLRPLAPDSPLAQSNHTRYPILQGPMTRVSDVPEFAARVAEQGALPFLALALMRGPEVKALLVQAQQRMGAMPWGVGILGFVPQELRQEQLDAIREYRPPFALIAGGRPDQARALEQQAIPTYLHVPSPGLLAMFIQQGARRFVFEGRECGGHVGPRTSFVLWNQMVDVLLEAPDLAANAQDFHIVFAAGVHDALSAAMVSVIAAPLAERGVRVGVLLGTAYLFTEEAVASGAIQKTFQEQAQLCRQTVLLETGPGHSTRCVDTPYAAAFLQEKRRLLQSGMPAEEIRVALESLNLGRLRIASKGVTRHPRFDQDPAAPKLIEIDKKEQVAQGMYMIGQVAALRHTVCTIASLHHAVSVDSLQKLEALAGRSWQAPSQRHESPRGGSPSNVAIIGMACLLPKAPDLQTYWENILHKVDAVTEIPQERWDWNLYFDSDPKAKDKIYSRWGGFLDKVAFDPIQYGMPPASLRSIEPAQLLALVVVRAALEDAGYLEHANTRERTSVILGAGGGAADLGLGYSARSFFPFLENLPEFHGRSREIVDRLGDRLPEWTEDSFAGILTNVSAGRVANRFDFGGSNFTVDAACASSLAAVSVALKELEAHSSDIVIAGGVDTMQNPFTYLCFSKTHALSPRGRCRTFDETADGIAISEGVAMIVLKRLEDAERDGDRIYAVIKGAGSSSDGKDRGLTAPRPEGQARALRRAYAKAGISPASVGLIEAHGTGTVAGDGAEVEALTQVFSEAQAQRQGCAIGSVKSMIGHTKCTAGAASLVKTALALHHKVLPPTLGVEKPNPRARFPETPFFVNTQARPWMQPLNGHPRRAGVSAFGFGGTNFHLVLEEYTGDTASCAALSLEWSHELFLYRAESRQALLENVEFWQKALAAQAQPLLRDLSYTAWRQAQDRQAGSHLHLAVIATSLEDLRQKLASAAESLAQPQTVQINDPRGVYFSAQPLAPEGKLAFLFPGQGSQYPGMLQDLLLHFPELRQTIEQAVRMLAGKLDEPLTSYIFPPPAFTSEEEKAHQQALTRTNVAQPAIGAVDLAMFHLLEELGIEPQMAAGHSYGEYVALASAGVFSLETLIALSEARGRFIVEGAGAEPGVMAAIDRDAGTVRDALKHIEGVCLANANAPSQTVISGTRAAVEKAVERCSARGMTARMIPVSCAFHSALVAPAQPRLAEFLAAANVAEPRFPVYSNTTAAPYPAEPRGVRELLVEHLVRPVEFVREIESMYAAGARIFVEVGPRAVLTSLVDQILGDRPNLAVASDHNGRPGLAQLLHLLGQLTAQGCVPELDRLYRGRSERRLNLATLERECAEKPLARSVWMINGSRATPLTATTTRSPQQPATNGLAAAIPGPVAEKPVPPARAAAAAAAFASSSPAPVQHTNGAPAVPYPSAPFAITPPAPPMATPPTTPISPAPAIAPPAIATSSDGVPAVMAQFQQMMTRFLDTQKTVMLAYLGGTHGQDIPAGVLPAPPIAALALRETVAPPAAAMPPKAAAAPAGPSKEDLTGKLLSIVSERTGYPPEMLDLNLDLEADLGIDSIKRVEILGTFQQSFAAAGSLEEGLMEKLTGVRTLQSIIDRVAEHLDSHSQAPAAAPISPVVPPLADARGSDPDRSRDRQGADLAVRLHASPFDQQQLTAQLLSIVSERTGYPPEMLDLKLDLEADLGIDSIKRVEILGTFQQSFAAAGSLEEGLMEKLTGVRTLQGIIDRLLGHAGLYTEASAVMRPGPIPAAIPSDRAVANGASPINAPTAGRIHRFTLTAVDAPLVGRRASLASNRPILILDAGHDLGRALARQLLAEGYQVAVVREGRGVQELDAGAYSADFLSPESVKELLTLVSQRQGPPCAIVHLLSIISEPDFAAINYDAWSGRLARGVKSLFYIAQTARNLLRNAAAESGAALIAATSMGGTFLSDLPAGALPTFPDHGAPDHGAIVGLIKTLALEWPEVRIKAVDLNLNDGADALSRHLFDELHAADGLVEVGYRNGRRVTLQPTHAPLAPQGAPALVLHSSSVVLITGGARGITALAAKRLAERYQPTLVLAGRSPLPPPEEAPETAGITTPKELKAALMGQMRARGETVTPALVERACARLNAEREIRATLAELRELGAKVHYHQLDVRDQTAFGAFIDNIYASFGRLDGVVHGAGVIEDKLIQDKTAESFDRVFHTKETSAFVLSRKLRPESLRFLVFFSSVAGRFGNRGQGDYAAANEVLNKLAVCLDRAWPGRVVALNWGPWDTGGMISPEVRKQFTERGVELIPPAVGLDCFEEELLYGRRGEAEVVIGGAGWQSSRKQEPAPHSWPLLRHVALPSGEAGRDLATEFVREFDPAHDLYLNDHRLDGQPVLPLAVATELMAEAAARISPELQVAAIRDLRLLHGVVLDSGPKTLRVVTRPQAGAASGPMSVAVEVAGAGHPSRIHYRATVDLAPRLPDAPRLQFAPLTDARAFSMEIADLYRQWLFHGPTFQGIHRVDLVSLSGVKASLATSSPDGWIAGPSQGQWIIDPLVFDSALQLVVLWAREHWDMTALPSGFQSYRRFAAPPASRITCEMRMRPNTGAQTIHADIFFLDAASGHMLGTIEDMHGACSKTLNRLAGREFAAAAGIQS
jgi:acyl transferase domain-containing protein/NAD(P)H-dependent flavin oxidoreductase YrpB (nitropropane dioxygenase family)/NAD(P)-dependent dehydrogenase (short-subunit alcohol dehydrogenase family)/acyl carrier protein